MDGGTAVVEWVLLAGKNPGAEARRRGFMNDRWKGERSDQFTGLDDGAAVVELVFRWAAFLACLAVCARWCAV